MAAYADTDDLALFWRPLVGDEPGRAEVLLGYAATLIRAEWPDMDDRLAAGFDPDLPKLVSLNMVKRALIGGTTGGEGVSSQMNVGGPYTQQQSYSNPMGNLYLTKEERRQLSPSGTRRKAFTINPMAEDAGTCLPWWDREPQP